MPVGERRNELTNARPLACAEGFCFREFRHSYLTALARADVHSKVMQVLAGHATCATIMDIYTHVNMDSKREAAEALARSPIRWSRSIPIAWPSAVSPLGPVV